MKHYTVTTHVNGELVGRQPIDDPFITNTTVVGWPDLVRALIRRRELKIVVRVDGSRDAIAHVMRKPIEPLPPMAPSGAAGAAGVAR